MFKSYLNIPDLTSQQIFNFWAKVDKSGDCWIWTGRLHARGYGTWRPSAKHPSFLTHRVSWFITHGILSTEIEVCHNCPGGDNPPCLRPTHLFLGTHADNLKDAGLKGMMRHGSNHHGAKLTEDAIRQIRLRYAEGNTSHQKLGDEFGVSNGVITRIINRKLWRHV